MICLRAEKISEYFVLLCFMTEPSKQNSVHDYLWTRKPNKREFTTIPDSRVDDLSWWFVSMRHEFVTIGWCFIEFSRILVLEYVEISWIQHARWSTLSWGHRIARHCRHCLQSRKTSTLVAKTRPPWLWPGSCLGCKKWFGWTWTSNLFELTNV